jgi:4-hydroxy-tetrahydrodipicolinate synthase
VSASEVSAPPRLQGIVGACLTPFKPDGRVDFGALEKEIEFMVADADAITIGAVEASEYRMLDATERRQLLREGARMVGGSKPLVLGASSPRVDTVAELAELAADENADYIQVLAPSRPWGGEPAAAELLAYFERVQEVSPLPIVAYHNPACGADPSLETWHRLSELPGVRAMKESSRDISKIGRMIENVQVTGNADYLTTMQPLLTTLLLGGAGATMPPPGTRIGARVLDAFRVGDLEKAREWQTVFSGFPSRWSRYGLPPVMKAAMRHYGVEIGDPRSPYRPVSPQDHIQIGEYLEAAGALR